MNANEWSHDRVGEGYSEEFKVKVSVHQGSVPSLLLFIIVLEALSRDFCSGFPWTAQPALPMTLVSSLNRLRNVSGGSSRKEAMEEKGLSKCRKDKDHDLWYGPGPPAEFKQVSMQSLSHWSAQQQHILK